MENSRFELKCRMSTGVGVAEFSALNNEQVSKKLKLMKNCESPEGFNSPLDRSTALGDYADEFEAELLRINDKNKHVTVDGKPSTDYFDLTPESEDAESINAPRLKTCTARFGGLEDMACLNDFLFNVSCYKMRFDIADDKAIGDLKYLLHGVARTWWNNLKVKPTTWAAATGLIRRTFEISPLVQQHFACYAYGMAQQQRRPTIDYLHYY